MNIPLIIAAVATTSALDLQQVLDQIRVEQEIPGVNVVVMTNSDSASPEKIAEALFDGVLF